MEIGRIKPSLLPLFLIALSFVGAFSQQPSPENPACGLNFSTYPYKPSGGCTNELPEDLTHSNGFPKTSCCQNALISYSHALALNALRDPSQNIFVSQGQWTSCTTPFSAQTSVSGHICGLDEACYNNNNGPCSNLRLSNIDHGVIQNCSRFAWSSFDDACGNCTAAIVKAQNDLLESAKDKDDDVEKLMCLLAVIVAVAANKLNQSSGIGDFDGCVPALYVPEPKNYIKVSDSVAEALLAVMVVILAVSAVIMLIKYKMKNQNKEKKKRPLLSKDISRKCAGLYFFSKSEIESAIHYKNEKQPLGRGSAGVVYKAMLPSGQVVAIKHINKSTTKDSFTREIENLSRVRHPNLVGLIGCCVEDGEFYIVYEYCSNGNLAQRLLRNDRVLTWEERIKILQKCAFALKYLHSHHDGCIVHRDIKLTNILLTHDMEPKLSDFGLARLLGMEESKVFTDVRGTIGYMDPEYMSNAKLTCASDIYSFGIVILQLLSGQKVIELDLGQRDQLTRKAKDVNTKSRPLTDFQDPRMKDVISMDFESILQIAVLCVASSSTGRPTIDLVCEDLLKALNNILQLQKSRKEKIYLDDSSTPSRSQEKFQL